MKNHTEPCILHEDLVELLLTLKAEPDIKKSGVAFRDYLCKVIPHADRVSINMNLSYGIADRADRLLAGLVEELVLTGRTWIGPASNQNDANESEQESNASETRKLKDFMVKVGFPVEQYHAPTMAHFRIRGQYVGTLIVFQNIERQPAVEIISETLHQLKPLVEFLMTDMIARYHQANPIEAGFFKAVFNLASDIDMSVPECKTAILLLYGFTYDQAADKLGLSVNTVRKYLMSVYRRANVHSLNELFAKYFVPKDRFAE